MDDYYHHFLTSMSGVGGYPAGKTDELTTSTLSNHSFSVPRSAMQNSYHYFQNLGSLPDQHHLHISNAGKARKKSMTGPAFGFEHVKHRRTRSGCFMCRSRRIKVLFHEPTQPNVMRYRRAALTGVLYYSCEIVSAMRVAQYVNVRSPRKLTASEYHSCSRGSALGALKSVLTPQNRLQERQSRLRIS